MEKIKRFYKNKRILVTGVTGFKGSWLCCWLLKLGARVYGTGFTPNQNKSLFYNLKLDNKINLKIFDIRNYTKLKNFISFSRPSIIFHLAAQPLVYESYQKPFSTFDINFRGTLNILEITKKLKFIRSIVLITTDKCYENVGKLKGYKETDKLGGVDPYSSSKAATELMIRAYRESFFINKRNCGISSARAGNVIGGGDWSDKRLIPDSVKSLMKNRTILLRNPNFNRPWQLVLEPLKGYLILAKKQFENPSKYSGAWNFGTESKSIISVKKLVKYIIKFWGNGKVKVAKKIKFYEQQNLQLNSNKAKKKLGWFPVHNIRQSTKITTEWYFKVLKQKKKPIDITNEQIDSYMEKNCWS